MKTLELKLKKDVLIVDLEDNEAGFINGNYDFLCDGSELTEEIASELFEYDDFLNCFKAYIDTVPSIDKSALKLFIKIFESKGFYWLENPFKDWKSDGEIHDDDLDLVYKEAEEKTFKNPLIFVKK